MHASVNTQKCGLYTLAERVGALLETRHYTLATAESCTGGWIAQAVTAIPGSSHWFERGFVTYSNRAKEEMLGVRHATLEQFGAVSEQTVTEMAAAVLTLSDADVSVAVSGIAGPSGGSNTRPVGLIWLAWAMKGEPPFATCHRFSGDRQQIRYQAVVAALGGVVNVVDS
ncbi:MAG: CinA family protein [Gammaproteobacteria bacterium]|nr:CinA family protein [Gammaproteobacteria bacterium]